MEQRPGRPGRVRAAALVLTAGLGVSGCVAGSDGATLPGAGASPSAASVPGGSPSAPASASPSPSTAPVSAPLTGRETTKEVATRPAVAVVVDDSAAPEGLEHADVVFEEFDDPGSHRMLAVFHSADAARVGPVGSTRPLDPPLLAVLHPLVGYSGGTKGFVKQLKNASVTDLSYLVYPSSYDRDSSGISVGTDELRALAPDDAPAPPPGLTFADPGEALGSTGVKEATRVTISVPDQEEVVWRYDEQDAVWRRGGDDGTDGIAVANLLVQEVPYKDVLVHFPSGPSVRSARVLGSGSAVVFGSGHYLRGKWSKPGVAKLTNYSDAAGVPVKLTPGPTWVLLVPEDTDVDVASS